MSDLKYSDHIETLTALVSYFALSKGKSRTPSGVANDLGLDKDKVQTVLNGFSGLFRKSRNTSNRTSRKGQHFYTLHVRYATRHLEPGNNANDDDNPELTVPLAAEYLSTILTMIQDRAKVESDLVLGNRQRVITLIGSWVAASAAILAAIISASK